VGLAALLLAASIQGSYPGACDSAENNPTVNDGRP